MTTWDYRIIRTLEPTIGSKDLIEWFQIHRVYYDGDKITLWEKEPSRAGGETIMELMNDMKAMQDACSREWLKAEDLPK